MPVNRRKPGPEVAPPRQAGEAPGFQGYGPDIDPALWLRAGRITKQEWVEMYQRLHDSEFGRAGLPAGSWLDFAESELYLMRRKKQEGE